MDFIAGIVLGLVLGIVIAGYAHISKTNRLRDLITEINEKLAEAHSMLEQEQRKQELASCKSKRTMWD